VPLIFSNYCEYSVVTQNTRWCRGSLASVYLQEVCQLLNDAQFSVSSIFVSYLPATKCCRDSLASVYLQEVCRLPEDAGLAVTSIFSGGLPITRWCRAPCHHFTPSPGPSSQPSSLSHSGYLSSTGLSYTNMW
jgi:hypothetical protein